MVRAKTFLVALLISFSAGAMPAFAHTSVVTTKPLYNSTLTEMPPQISIEFSDDLMKIGNNAVNTISIESPDKSDVLISTIEIKKNLITAKVPKGVYQDGTYLVSYRVVSADGHPVSGSYSLFLNAPSVAITQPVAEVQHHGFFHIHQTHFIQGGVVLMLIALWWGYRRFNREVGE
jgi:methionine-rich copper-binding protein CopC